MHLLGEQVSFLINYRRGLEGGETYSHTLVEPRNWINCITRNWSTFFFFFFSFAISVRLGVSHIYPFSFLFYRLSIVTVDNWLT